MRSFVGLGSVRLQADFSRSFMYPDTGVVASFSHLPLCVSVAGPAMGIWPSGIFASTSMKPLLLADLMGPRNTLAFPQRQRECVSEIWPIDYGMHMR